jgi:hypothetical protein
MPLARPSLDAPPLTLRGASITDGPLMACRLLAQGTSPRRVEGLNAARPPLHWGQRTPERSALAPCPGSMVDSPMPRRKVSKLPREVRACFRAAAARRQRVHAIYQRFGAPELGVGLAEAMREAGLCHSRTIT